MSFSKNPSLFNSANGLGLPSQSQVTQQQQFPIGSRLQSNSHSQQKRQPINPWSAHTPPMGQSPSPFLREGHALSTTATAAGELFLFGGYVHSSLTASNDLYMVSTRDFSATLLKTSGDVPNPRYGHGAAFTNTALLILGGRVTSVTRMRRKKEDGHDDSLYLLNFASRKWTRVVVKGPRPSGRFYHTVTLVGSKLFAFGGWDCDALMYFNDIWAFDLDYLKSNPRWELYIPAPGNEKPLPRNGHISVTTGDHIIIFGGRDRGHCFNDTWSFNISTRKWTEIQCTGSIPSPRLAHAAILFDNVMYVFGGRTIDGTYLGDLTALNLSTQRWIAFQDIGRGPRGRSYHAMASDGPRVILLGGRFSSNSNESELVYVLDTERITHPDLDPNAVDPSERAAQLARESSAGPSTQGQPQQTTFSLSYSDCVPEEDNDSEGSTEHHAKFVAPGVSSKKEVARSEHARIADLERQLSDTLAAQTERDRRIGQLTDQLVQNSALLEQAEANTAGAEKRAGLVQRELQAKLDELMLLHDEHLRMLEQAQGAPQKATSPAADANERSQHACEEIGEYETKLAEVRAELEEKTFELEAVRLQLTDANDGCGSIKSSSNAEKSRAQNTNMAGPVNTDEGRDTRGIMERMRAMETEIASLRWSEKSFERNECSNEG